MMKKFAHLLGTYVENSGLKQIYIAATAGISYNYLQRLLSGNRNPSDQVVSKLAEVLRLSPLQTGELLTAAGYAPPADLLSPMTDQENKVSSPSPPEFNEVMQMAQQLYKLAGEIPEQLQPLFFDEMKHLFGYARYKYVLSGSTNVLDLNTFLSRDNIPNTSDGSSWREQSHLDLIAQIIGELQHEHDDHDSYASEELSQPPQAVEDMLSAVDRLLGNILGGEMSSSEYHVHVIVQMLEMLRQGTPWEIRRRIAEALPKLFRFNNVEAENLMEMLRLDIDDLRGVDIRRRVVETLPDLFRASPRSFPTLLRLLHPKPGDDIYVALATIETCGDIQTQIKHLIENGRDIPAQAENTTSIFRQHQAEISKIQRQLLLDWDGREKESLQFSMALRSLLCDPEMLLLSLDEGLHSGEKLMQIVAARYLEYALSSKTIETLHLYRMVLTLSKQRNVRRTVAKALPGLLHSLKSASLPARALVRDIISSLASDPDIYIRRAVADHAMQIFQIDREFLLILLRLMHKDTDRVIRHRLQPIALNLAQVWLVWYAETAGLVDTKHRQKKAVMPFGE